MNPLRLVIVEDVEDDARLLLRELARGGYDVTHHRVETAAALRDALRIQTWDLVISDDSLPNLNALGTLKVLADSRLDVPCIVLSGTIEEESAVEVLRSGARDFIVKDRLARLLPAISRELAEAAQRRQKRVAEAALEDARSRMQFALEAAGVGTWEADIADGTTVWSDVLERLHGLPVGGFPGTFEAFLEVVHPDDRQALRDRIEQARGEHAEARVEYRVTWPDGSVHWISRVGRAFYDNAGRPVRAAGIGLDITVQKHLEEQFRHAQRMESIGTLAGGIAHDFNNLLTAILGYSNFLLEELVNPIVPDQLRGDLEEIRRAGERAAQLTRQLLAFSRKQIIQPTVLNVNATVEGLAPMLRRVIGEDIQLATRIASDLGSVKADAGQLEQIVMNLVVNARDAMPSGGRLTIETANVELDDAYARTHIAVVPGRYVMLAVSDTGVGMSPEIQARLFEPFFTTKPMGRGTGLGLATIYGIVKQNNGNIWVCSELGRGTTFKIYLPRVDAAPDRVAPRAEVADYSGHETVLLVEDDERVRRLARQILKRSGYVVVEAEDPEEAVRLAAQHAESIKLLLTDIVMPGRSGGSLAQELIEKYPHLKVLYMSGYTDNAIVQHGVLTPGVTFLQKPFTPATFARAVRKVLDRDVQTEQEPR